MMRRWIAGLALALLAGAGHAQTPVCSATSDSASGGSETTCTITIHVACTPCPSPTPAPTPTPGPFGGHATLTDGLVSYWPLDEESGVRADLVGSNDLTDNNTVGFASVTGPPNFPGGKAASFVAANNEYLGLASAFSGVEGPAFSVSLWVRHTDSTLDELMWNGTGAFGIQVETDGDVTVYASPTQYRISTATGIVVQDEWVHLCVVYDGAEGTAADRLKLYKNSGANVLDNGSGTIPATMGSSSPFEIGRYPGGGFNWQGQIGHVAIWSRVLTTQERTDLYNSGAGLFYED